MKKILVILISISLLVCTLCSCNSSADQDTSTDNTSAKTDSASAKVISGSENTTTDKTTAATTVSGTAASASVKSTDKVVTEIIKSTQRVTAKSTATKKSTTKSPSKSYGNHEVSPSSVTRYGGTIQRAWKLSSGSVSAEIHKVAYGPKITQNFRKSEDGAMDVSSKSVTYQPICNIALITCKPTDLKFAVTAQTLGKTTGKLTDVAANVGALIAVNGEPLSSIGSIAIRNGTVYTPDGSPRNSFMLYKDGRKADYKDLSKQTQNSLIAEGAYNSVRYQDILIRDGVKNHISESYHHNRTVIAQISSNKYILAVGEFMPFDTMADLLIKYGAKEAVAVNGGNCSFMYARGVGNVTGTRATQLKNLDKINIIESEFFANHGMLGLNNAGKPKLGGPCSDESNIIYVK